ncbi:hypothetical protein [Bosea vestrisii]|uniref:Uncharacterized protein n=1 Tax=Bosea vestrisii TaxID=151416 RepID=A0ABW0H435_9HYPH
MTNPYWHTAYKPHLVDAAEIRGLCFDLSNIVTASRSKQGTGEQRDPEDDPRFTHTERLCFQMAEDELSRRLLRLAVLIRTFDDIMANSPVADAYRSHRDAAEKDVALGSVYTGDERITDTLRECCNKIIHADDVRPTYETDDDRHDEFARWGMTGMIELEGKLRGANWSIVICIDNLIEAVLDLLTFADQMDELYRTTIPEGRIA